MDDESNDRLTAMIADETAQPVNEAVTMLTDAVTAQGKGIAAVLFYGSGLWKEAAADTVYDFYVLVDSYRGFNNKPVHAFFGSLLPPNVYYLEREDGARTLRCKYAVIRTDQFEKAAKGRTMTPQIWARFAQPCRITYARDESTKVEMHKLISRAVVTFHEKTLPLVASDSVQNTDARTLWETGLKETYSREWRSEKGNRGQDIFKSNADRFENATKWALPLADVAVKPCNKGTTRFEKAVGKIIYFFQLLKAPLTFEGGVDYALWKVERQSGVRVEATAFQKRYPLIAGWPLLWKIYRAGGLR